MCCYFMRNGHIASVEPLEGVSDDAAAIKLGSASFLKRLRDGFEGFEIWERDRMVFRYPEDESQAGPEGKSAGRSSPKGSGKGPSQASPAFYAGMAESIALPI